MFLNDKMAKALELKLEEMVGRSESYLEIVRSQLVQVGLPYSHAGHEIESWRENQVQGGNFEGSEHGGSIE